MLGVLQQPALAPTQAPTLVVRKFVLRFVNRVDLLHCVALLRDCGARVSGDAPNDRAPPTIDIDVKPQLSSLVPPPMHLKDAPPSAENNSSQQWWAGTQPGANTNTTAPQFIEQQSSSLKRKQSSSMDDPFEGFENNNNNNASQFFGAGLIDENAPPNGNKQARLEQPTTALHQRIAAVLSAPDFESKLAAVERALTSVIQRDAGARRRWMARSSSSSGVAQTNG